MIDHDQHIHVEPSISMQSRVVYLLPVWMDVCARWIHTMMPFLGSFVCIRTSSKPPVFLGRDRKLHGRDRRESRSDDSWGLVRNQQASCIRTRYRVQILDVYSIVDALFYFHGLQSLQFSSSPVLQSLLDALSFISSPSADWIHPAKGAK